MVVVPGTQADEVLAVGLELDAAGADQRHQVDLPLDPLQLFLGDSWHLRLLSKNVSIRGSAELD